MSPRESRELVVGQGADEQSVCVCVSVCGGFQVANFIYHVAPPLPRALLLSSVRDEHPQDLSALHPIIGVCACACLWRRRKERMWRGEHHLLSEESRSVEQVGLLVFVG